MIAPVRGWLVTESISHGSHRADQALFAWPIDLGTQAVDVELKRILRWLGGETPSRLDQLAPADDFVGASHQQFEQGKLMARERGHRAVPLDLTAAWIEDQA